jgi:hypothetical protein
MKFEDQPVKPGTVLKNGATVIASKGGMLLAQNGREYVTWGYQVADDGIDCFWGHYIQGLDAAIADFNERN